MSARPRSRCASARRARAVAAQRDADVQDDDRLAAGDAGLAGRGGVTIAAMESTSTYWKPPFYCLEELMEVWLLNAAHMKAVPGRKTDVRDAEWIAQLLEHGLLAPSFVPPPEIRRLRMLTRYRMQLMGDRTRDTVRLELMLEDASIKLSSVASSLTTVSARAMLAAMIDGETDPLRLADLAKGKMRRKIPDLAQALTGHFDARPRPAGQARCCAGWTWSSRRWPSSTRSSPPRASRGRTRSSCCRPSPASGRRSRRSSSPRPARTCHGSRPRRTWRPGPGWRRRCTSPPAGRPRPGSGTATSG